MNTTYFVFEPISATRRTTVTATPLGRVSSPARGLRGIVIHWSLQRSRSGQSYESFACFFAGQGIPEPILQETYRILARKIFLFPAFPVHPLDSLRKIYDLDCYRGGALTELLQEVQRSTPLRFYKPVPAFLPCETVEDLVYLLAARCDAPYIPTDRPCPQKGGPCGDTDKMISEAI